MLRVVDFGAGSPSCVSGYGYGCRAAVCCGIDDDRTEWCSEGALRGFRGGALGELHPFSGGGEDGRFCSRENTRVRAKGVVLLVDRRPVSKGPGFGLVGGGRREEGDRYSKEWRFGSCVGKGGVGGKKGEEGGVGDC